MKRTLRFARWGAINAAVATVTWLGAIEGVQWAANVARFYAWGVFAFSLFVAVVTLLVVVAIAMEDDPGDLVEPTALPFPRWLDILVDCAVALTMASVGWFITAGAFVAHSVIGHLSHSVWGHSYEQKKKELEATP